MPNSLAASSNAIWASQDHLPMGLAFGVVDGGGVDEDAEDIGLCLHSSTIGMHSSDDSDDESSEFDAFWFIGGGSQCVSIWWGIVVQWCRKRCRKCNDFVAPLHHHGKKCNKKCNAMVKKLLRKVSIENEMCCHHKCEQTTAIPILLSWHISNVKESETFIIKIYACLPF